MADSDRSLVTKNDHEFHIRVARILKQAVEGRSDIKLVLDEACSGSGEVQEHVPLFTYLGDSPVRHLQTLDVKSETSRYCNVDSLILTMPGPSDVQTIIEIEYSGIDPNKVCGKFLTTALSSCYIHYNYGNRPIPIARDSSFIQILCRTEAMRKGRSVIEEKMEHIRNRVRQVLATGAFNISSYDLIVIDYEPSNLDQKAIISAVKASINRSRPLNKPTVDESNGFVLEEAFEEKVGYKFHHQQYRTRAITRRAWYNDQGPDTKVPYPGLATLGDAIIGLVVVKHFFELGKTPQEITEEKNSRVSRVNHTAIATKMGLLSCLRLGGCEGDDEEWVKGSALGESFEEAIGAIYLDDTASGRTGFKACEQVLMHVGLL